MSEPEIPAPRAATSRPTWSRTPMALRHEHHHTDFPLDALLAAKGSCRISVCIPARNEEATLGAIVALVRTELMNECHLVDELLVIDHGSTDSTAAVAEAAGARVFGADSILPEYGPALGKGDVLWRSLAISTGDIVVWLDADLVGLTAGVVSGVIGPLLHDPRVVLSRAVYERSLGGSAGEGGRVTELTARPVLSLLHPRLAHVRQPLGGEYAARRDALEAVPFEPDYGVEMGLLIDIADRFGPDAIAQVDVGERVHRNRPLSALSGQAREVLRAALTRAQSQAAPGLRGDLPLRPALAELRSRSLVS